MKDAAGYINEILNTTTPNKVVFTIYAHPNPNATHRDVPIKSIVQQYAGPYNYAGFIAVFDIHSNKKLTKKKQNKIPIFLSLVVHQCFLIMTFHT